MYASAVAFLARYSLDEIAQRADTSVPPLVDGELLHLAAEGADLTAYSPEERAAAAAALARVNQVLQDADNTINGYLAGRYQVPVVQAEEVLERIAGQLARYYLYDDGAPEHVEKRHADSLSFLRDVSAGRVQLGTAADGSTAPVAASAGAEMVSGGLVFGRDSSRGFI